MKIPKRDISKRLYNHPTILWLNYQGILQRIGIFPRTRVLFVVGNKENETEQEYQI
jgi:hypothetical protein